MHNLASMKKANCCNKIQEDTGGIVFALNKPRLTAETDFWVENFKAEEVDELPVEVCAMTAK